MIVFERFAVAVLLFSATGVTTLSRSSMTWENLLVPVFLGALALFLSFRYSLGVSRPIMYFMIGYLILFLCQLLVYGSLHPKHLVLYPLNFWIAYCFVRAMKERFLFHLELLITFFSGVAFFIWILDVLTSGSVRQLLSGFVMGQAYSDIIDSYILLYTVVDEGVDSLFPRNSGFAWEPGAFAVFCCLGLLINFYRTGFCFKGNRGAIVLILALLSSQSTTGYSIFFVILIAKMFQDAQGSVRIIVPFLVTALALLLFSLPFMQDKIVNLWVQDLDELAYAATSAWNLDKPIAAQRFLSFRLDFNDFLNNPWTGYGGRDSEMFVESQFLNIVSISGVGKVMAKFGIVGLGFFLLTTVLSSMRLNREFNSTSPALLALLILMVSVSYSLIEHPIFLALWAYWLFAYADKSASVVHRTVGVSNR